MEEDSQDSRGRWHRGTNSHARIQELEAQLEQERQRCADKDKQLQAKEAVLSRLQKRMSQLEDTIEQQKRTSKALHTSNEVVIDLQKQLAEELAKRKQAQYLLISKARELCEVQQQHAQGRQSLQETKEGKDLERGSRRGDCMSSPSETPRTGSPSSSPLTSCSSVYRQSSSPPSGTSSKSPTVPPLRLPVSSGALNDSLSSTRFLRVDTPWEPPRTHAFLNGGIGLIGPVPGYHSPGHPGLGSFPYPPYPYMVRERSGPVAATARVSPASRQPVVQTVYLESPRFSA